MSVTWTDEQQKVIDLRGRNILVSAAAGSGKTAVLVERIISRLTKENPPLNVDQLLIMTFTEAAAAEMKERIGAAIEKALEEQPNDEHLKKQSILIHTARISTIHSFCSSVIRDHFHTIDLDPGFRVAEEGELTLLKQEVMKELLEDSYAKAEDSFLQFVECFSTGRDDSNLEKYILQVYEFAESNPLPEQWLEECMEIYEEGIGEGTAFCGRLMAYIQNCLHDIEKDMERARELCAVAGGPYMYETTIEADQEKVSSLFLAQQYGVLYRRFADLGTWNRMASNRDPDVDKELAEYVKELRNGWKDKIEELKEQFFFQSPEEMNKDLQACVPVMRVLIDLTKEFRERFASKKAERNMIDFNDMEHFAIKILTKNENGTLVPSEIAKEYQDKFEEVMVDEYQDSNLVQETILNSVSRVSRGENNIFMVGDVKQSIYRFRLSRPELFTDKFDTYTLEESKCQRVDLHKNFRSRSEVIDFVNDIFSHIMRKEVGNVLYDEKAALNVGAEYEMASGNVPELLLINTELEEPMGEKAKINARELEAKVIAGRIHELMETQRVWDKTLGQMRDVRYSDIVILTRSLKGWADVFVRILKQEGIPAYTDSKEGYFGTLEIGWLLDYLRVLDNFRQDIPLTSVLKSPFGKFTNEELAQIRNAYPDKVFHEAVLQIAELQKDCPLGQKVEQVLEKMRQFRACIPYTAIHDLLWKIMDETGYLEEIGAMPGGEQRAANLNLLIVKAKAFEATSYKGLFHFVRYIEQIREYNIDYGEADIQGESTDAVRVLSIHKSKGLEFPVVIVAGMGKGFNIQDVTGEIVIHPELGIGIRSVDIESRTAVSTILRNLIQTETQIENLGEELRVLYVALTRAKEKLILTGTLKKAKEKIQRYTINTGNGPLSFLELLRGKRYWDWVLPVVCEMSGGTRVKMELLSFEDVVESEIEREEKAKELILNAENQAYAKELREQFSYQYPHLEEETMKLKYAVSELKERAMMENPELEMGETFLKESDETVLIPGFMREEEKLTGASRGSAYHKVLELLDFTESYGEEMLAETLDQFEREGFLSAEMKACVRKRDLLAFIESPAGKRMHEAAKRGSLFKEQQFVFGIDAKEMYPGTTSKELVLIQGIIDVYFEEEDGLVVLDYKTDKVEKASELLERYREQLELYARSLEQMTNKKVKEKIIYSFTLKEEIHWS